jgi:energy-coupling factor transport system ATP-binding protein
VLIDGQDTSGRRVATLAGIVGLAFQDPDRQIFAGRVQAESGVRAAKPRAARTDLQRVVERALITTGLDREARTLATSVSRGAAPALAPSWRWNARRRPRRATTGQDARGIDRVQAIVDDLATRGRTVVAISHDMRFVAESFERVIVMRGGRVVLAGSPAQVFARDAWPVLASTYLEAPLAARVGARLDLGATPTEASLVEALAARA